MNEQIESLLKDRDEEYGDAWKTSGEILHTLSEHLNELIRKAPQYVYAWLMILNKLIRACRTPYNMDHWIDIQGYAKLVSDDIHREDHRWKEQPDGDKPSDTKSDAGVGSDVGS